MRFSALVIALALVASAVAPKDGRGKDTSALGRSDRANTVGQEASDATKAANRQNHATIKAGSESVSADDISSGERSIEQQKADAVREKHTCDCDACKMFVQGEENQAFDTDMLSCKTANDEAKAAVVTATEALAAAKAALYSARAKHKILINHKATDCTARANSHSVIVATKNSDINAPTAAVDGEQAKVNQLIADQDSLRGVAMEKDLEQYNANQGVVNAQYKLLEGRDTGKQFFRKHCMCDEGRLQVQNGKKRSYSDVVQGQGQAPTFTTYYHEAYENILHKKDGTECSKDVTDTWINTKDPETGPVKIETPVYPARNPKCVIDGETYTGQGGVQVGGQQTQASKDRAETATTNKAAANQANPSRRKGVV